MDRVEQLLSTEAAQAGLYEFLHRRAAEQGTSVEKLEVQIVEQFRDQAVEVPERSGSDLTASLLRGEPAGRSAPLLPQPAVSRKADEARGGRVLGPRGQAADQHRAPSAPSDPRPL